MYIRIKSNKLRSRLQHLYLLLFFLFISSLGISNPAVQDIRPKKKIEAVRTHSAPKIDGILDEKEWLQATPASDFIVYIPRNGATAKQKTDVYVLYDDVALYVGAYMYDENPDSIYIELGQRDANKMLNADDFSVDLSPYNDGVNGFRFKVSASGVQSDSRIEISEGGLGGGGGGGSGGRGSGGGGSQDSWDAVWDSKVSLTDKGWVAEIRIPYSALRFPNEDVQTWGINFWREVRRTREQSSWNFVDRNIGSPINHLGELSNIKNIKPPLRLSMTPYVSSYLEKTSDVKANFTYNGGLDIKLGLNESFTIDATLVPDFGQVQSDDQVLNLTPYEVKYNEKRPFFMEGTELFDKGDIFYSRRIGAEPRLYDDAYDNLNANERVSINPKEAGLINSTKLSGRTRFGLGIGVFNGMTKETFATIEDTISGETRHVKTEPFTNLNMIVLDQNLGNNSYVSLENTNVWRNHSKDENYYTANVTGTDFRIQSGNQLFSIDGKASVSQKYYDSMDTEYGHSFDIKAGKSGGAFRVVYNLKGISDTYDPNDMGYLRRNNEFMNELQVSYNMNKPFWIINSNRTSFQYNYAQLYTPRVFTTTTMDISSMTVFRNFSTFSLRLELNPKGMNDYYEPRVDGWYYHKGGEIRPSVSFGTSRNKRISINLRGEIAKINSAYDQRDIKLSILPTFRISNRFSINHQLQFDASINDIGYVDDNGTDEIIFGKRDSKTIENTFTAGYIFTANSYLSFRLRHYWAIADYNSDFYYLKPDGSLEPNTTFNENIDDNYNSFNIDMIYNWRFAPGSDLSIVWKNAIYSSGDYIFPNFKENLNDMFDQSQSNSISFKLLYYLDYQQLKKSR